MHILSHLPQRAEVVTGAYEPTKEECKWTSDGDGEEEDEEEEGQSPSKKGWEHHHEHYMYTCTCVVTRL